MWRTSLSLCYIEGKFQDGTAGGRSAPDCPIRRSESSARISERRPEFNGGGHWGRTGFGVGPASLDPETLEMRRGNSRAIAASHQHAILGLAQIRDAHR